MKTKKKTDYYSLPIVPTLLAEIVVGQPYTAMEWSEGLREGSTIAKVESTRLALTVDERREFCDLCEKRSKAAYDADAKWFMKALRSKYCREQLIVTYSHWLSAYCQNRDSFRRSCDVPMGQTYRPEAA